MVEAETQLGVRDPDLERIDAHQESILAYITVTADDAREAARKAESEIMGGNWRGPFHGVPIALKDLCNTRSVLTTGGVAGLIGFELRRIL